jgi:hypothetical protein
MLNLQLLYAGFDGRELNSDSINERFFGILGMGFHRIIGMQNLCQVGIVEIGYGI